MKYFIALFTLCTSFLSYAGGDGDLIGNGAGLAEHNFYYSIQKIPNIINQCFQSHLCALSPAQKEVIQKIQTIAINNADNAELLHFISGRDNPGFFNDGQDGEVRLAKTSFIPGAKIFINLDLVYNSGQLAITLLQSTSLLIHELGHQAGVRSHGELDLLASKIAVFLERDLQKSKVHLEDFPLEFYSQNFKNPLAQTDSSLTFRGKRFDLKKIINQSIKCQRKRIVSIGYSLSNLHWERPIYNTRSDLVTIALKAWVKLFCLDSNEAIWREDRDLTLILNFKKVEYPDGRDRPVLLDYFAKSL
ncbi:MAG: hypothetical protein HN509_07880 [Halobacteriovoraceae bacterium]|jgi:hypothetical protein|nr:hypothetical protein [Halobacteriovoraceae bacterium]MBT5096144.1 hypothetical protein [Halobacteriovoraceae bacterium]